MMLRTTISRTRKVCSLGIVPRVLRDDVCNGPASYAVIRKAHKSTKSTDDGTGPTEKGTDFPILKTTSIDTTTGIPLTHREKCQKIIDQAFGPGSVEPDSVSKEQYCSHKVNIETTRREMQEAENERIKLQNMKIDNPIIPDDRQYGIFKMSRELIKLGNDEDEIMVEENTTKKAPPTRTLTQNEAACQTFAVSKELLKTFNMTSDKEPHLKIDGLKKIQLETAPLNEPNLDCAKVDHKLNISNPVISDTVGNKAELYDGNVYAGNPAVNPYHKWVLNATTAKEKEEKLAQKLETIEETPHVEAPVIEGFNVNPKVLGDQLNPSSKCTSIYKKQGNVQEGVLPRTYDEVATRCLKHPLEQIDEMLVKEMDKIGHPLTGEPEKKTPSTLIGNELVQMDLCNEKQQLQQQEIYPKIAESEDRDEERDNKVNMSPSSIRQRFFQVSLPNLNEQPEEMTLRTSEDIKPVKKDGVPNPDQIKKVKSKKEIKPVSCDNNPAVKFSSYRTSELEKGTPHTAEAVKPAINPINVSSDLPVSHASGNIGAKGQFLPEYNSNYKRVRGPSHYGTSNASDLAEHDHENSYSRYLASKYSWDQAKEPFATKFYFNESDEVECHNRTPEFQPEKMEEQAVQKLHSDEDSKCKLNPESVKVTLPEELLKEHELDPYYVLTCNETCPISPGSSMSACRNPDFVDSTETVYMKKNICESLRPRKTHDNQIMPFENVIAERPKVDVQSLSQYENLTIDTKSQVNDKINISESIQPKLDGTQLVTSQSENVTADTQAQLHNIDLELIPETAPEIEDLPNIKSTVVLPEHPSLQRNQQGTLTELLNMVRERNRAQCTSQLGVKVDPTEGKCNRRAPRCNPVAPRSPPSNPIPPPSFGLPMVKRRPEICMPKKKGGGCSKKCAACDIDVACGVQLGEICPEIACELGEAEACATISRVDLTEVVLDRIQTLGKMVGGVFRQVTSNVETLLARDYEPWAPIPSWPLPKKEEKQCAKWTPGYSNVPPCVRGCPVFPKARASMNPEPPCNLKPCEGFPKRRSFSACDCFAVFLGTNTVYDLGQF